MSEPRPDFTRVELTNGNYLVIKGTVADFWHVLNTATGVIDLELATGKPARLINRSAVLGVWELS